MDLCGGFYVPKVNPPVRDRVNCVNAVLRNTAGDNRLKADPRCQQLILDFERVRLENRCQRQLARRPRQIRSRPHARQRCAGIYELDRVWYAIERRVHARSNAVVCFKRWQGCVWAGGGSGTAPHWPALDVFGDFTNHRDRAGESLQQCSGTAASTVLRVMTNPHDLRRFSCGLPPAAVRMVSSSRDRHVYAALLGHAMDLTAQRVSLMTPGLSVDGLTNALQLLEDGQTMRRANAAAVEPVRAHPIAAAWGDAKTAPRMP